MDTYTELQWTVHFPGLGSGESGPGRSQKFGVSGSVLSRRGGRIVFGLLVPGPLGALTLSVLSEGGAPDERFPPHLLGWPVGVFEGHEGEGRVDPSLQRHNLVRVVESSCSSPQKGRGGPEV